MRKLLLVASAVCAVGLSVSTASAAPAGGILETLKTTASEASVVQDVRYYRGRHYRRHHAYRNCWWQDRWMCRYFW
jgi:hypothetical protein